VFFVPGYEVSAHLPYIFQMPFAIHLVYATFVVYVCGVFFLLDVVVSYIAFFILYAICMSVFFNNQVVALVFFLMCVNVTHFFLSCCVGCRVFVLFGVCI
jgi:hypothetical protein